MTRSTAPRDLLAPHRGCEQELRRDGSTLVDVASDQQVREHRRALEELDVLERAGDAEGGDPRRRAIEQAQAPEADLAFVGIVEA